MLHAKKNPTDAAKSLEHSAQGNIVLSLSGQNAARLLLNAVNDLFGTSAANLPAAQRTHEKEKEFYAAVFDSEPKVRGFISVRHPDTDLFISVPARLVQGSDSREDHGWRSLERSNVGRDGRRSQEGQPHRGESASTTANQPGHENAESRCVAEQFLHRPDSVSTPNPLRDVTDNQLAFLAVPASNSAPHFSATECPGTGDVSTSQRFLAASENGVVIESGEVGTARPPPRICAIEGTRTTLQ